MAWICEYRAALDGVDSFLRRRVAAGFYPLDALMVGELFKIFTGKVHSSIKPRELPRIPSMLF